MDLNRAYGIRDLGDYEGSWQEAAVAMDKPNDKTQLKKDWVAIRVQQWRPYRDPEWKSSESEDESTESEEVEEQKKDGRSGKKSKSSRTKPEVSGKKRRKKKKKKSRRGGHWDDHLSLCVRPLYHQCFTCFSLIFHFSFTVFVLLESHCELYTGYVAPGYDRS